MWLPIAKNTDQLFKDTKNTINRILSAEVSEELQKLSLKVLEDTTEHYHQKSLYYLGTSYTEQVLYSILTFLLEYAKLPYIFMPYASAPHRAGGIICFRESALDKTDTLLLSEYTKYVRVLESATDQFSIYKDTTGSTLQQILYHLSMAEGYPGAIIPVESFTFHKSYQILQDFNIPDISAEMLKNSEDEKYYIGILGVNNYSPAKSYTPLKPTAEKTCSVSFVSAEEGTPEDKVYWRHSINTDIGAYTQNWMHHLVFMATTTEKSIILDIRELANHLLASMDGTPNLAINPDHLYLVLVPLPAVSTGPRPEDLDQGRIELIEFHSILNSVRSQDDKLVLGQKLLNSSATSIMLRVMERGADWLGIDLKSDTLYMIDTTESISLPVGYCLLRTDRELKGLPLPEYVLQQLTQDDGNELDVPDDLGDPGDIDNHNNLFPLAMKRLQDLIKALEEYNDDDEDCDDPEI